MNISNFIWNIADDVLRDVYVRGKYRDVILPMTVIRRLDAVLEPTKDAVLSMKGQLDRAGVANQHAALCQASGEAFYNTSQFRLRDLASRARRQQLKSDFETYLDGFSPNVQEVLDKFKFRNQIPTLVEADALGFLLEKFLDPTVNLSPKAVLHQDGSVRLPGLDNHSMGTIFEELIRRFNEENNEEAGEHFTPRDVVELMAYLIFMPIADEIQSGTYLVYDGACGTGGMLTVAEETLVKLASDHGKEVSVHLYGQEVNPETFAISKADLILKGEGAEAENMKYGSTLSSDAFPSGEFDFMLSNPPYGKSWKSDLDRLGGKKDIGDPRFVIDHGGDPEYSLITRSSDGQMVFLANMLSKMKTATKVGSRIAEVHNGSSLFTGDAGSGESNVRRWAIEKDWLEAIIALPLNIFYNTGIATYIWVLSNRKAPSRKGKVQLIDATAWFKPLRKNLGKKNCVLGPHDIKRICETFLDSEESEQSKVFPNDAFGYWKVTVERPLRIKVDLSPNALRRFSKLATAAAEGPLVTLVDKVTLRLGEGPHSDFNRFLKEIETEASKRSVRMTAKREKLLMAGLGIKDTEAAPVIKRVSKVPPNADPQADVLHGRYHRTIAGKPAVVEYEPDTELRDTEQVPFLEEGGIDAFFLREVLPHASDAWIDPSKTVIGYEISFTRHFYKPQPLRTLQEIEADIRALEQETDGLLEDVLTGRL
ncbi:type I restriction-modification system subunit M [Mesorhizobium tamadayense]|uniref:type I restriction-modification system subunit M n=1 Tax=Mesorhizobium tamadayense TaxID=425306 RepID=UPI001FDFD81B|nr:class I SAM-dependent DNA methyltransferase [Mesorhizobium tamadayense]